MQQFSLCFGKVKKDCLKFIKSQETKADKFKNKERMIKSFLIPLCFWINKKVLIVDADPQGNASTGLGIDENNRSPCLYKMLSDGEFDQKSIKKTTIPNLDIITSTNDLAASELELVEIPERESRLKNILNNVDGYDYFFIDCPPALNMLTVNALTAAHSVLVPIQCEYYALEGLSHLVRTINRVKRAFNPLLEIQGVVLTMYDRRNNLSDMVAADVREHFGDKVYRTVIPRNVRVSEAPSHGKPVLVYDWRCVGSQAYIHLAREMLQRERQVGS